MTQSAAYTYRIRSTGESSSRYGPCEVCREHCSDVHLQVELRFYSHEHNGERYEGLTRHGCHTLFGHAACLTRRRQSAPLQAEKELVEA